MLIKRILSCLVLVTIFSTLIITTGCAVINGSGNVIMREFDYTDFTKLEVGYAFNAEITRADSYTVKISLDDNLFDYLIVEQSDDTLRITMKPGNVYSKTQQRAEITLPDLERLELSGASKAQVNDFTSSHYLEMDISGASHAEISNVVCGDAYLEISGASKIEGTFTMNDVVFHVSGASSVELEGSAENMALEASGASQVDLSDFTIVNAGIELSGASRATVNASGQISGDLSGASLLEYLGDATLGTFSSTGGSEIRSK
jgi:hypothetical protein